MPPLPRRVSILAGVIGLAFLVAKAAIGEPDNFETRLSSEALGILAGVAFAASGINEVVRVWQRRSVKRATGWIVIGLMQRLINEAAALAAAAKDVLDEACSPEVFDGASIQRAFFIPLDEFSKSHARRLADGGSDLITQFAEDPADEQARRRVIEAARNAIPALGSGVQRVSDLVSELCSYRPDEKEANELLRTCVELTNAAAELDGHLSPQNRQPGPDQREAAYEAVKGTGRILSSSVKLLPLLSAGYRDTRAHMPLPDVSGGIGVSVTAHPG
jgi:hypothetical protein